MEQNGLCDAGVVTFVDGCDHSRRDIVQTVFPGNFSCFPGIQQNGLHCRCPVFLFNFDQRLQLTQVMGIAKCMRDTFHFAVGYPVVVHRYARHARQQIASTASHSEMAHRQRTDDMLPPGPASNPQTRFIQMFDRNLLTAQHFTHKIRERTHFPGHLCDETRQCRCRDPYTAQVEKHLRQTIIRNAVMSLKIGRHGRNVIAILNRRSDPFRESATCKLATARAHALMGSMFSDRQRRWRGQVEHLAGDETLRRTV